MAESKGTGEDHLIWDEVLSSDTILEINKLNILETEPHDDCFCFVLREDVDYWHPPFLQACVQHWCVLQRSRQSFRDLQLFIPHMLHVWIIYLHRKVKHCPHEQREMACRR